MGHGTQKWSWFLKIITHLWSLEIPLAQNDPKYHENWKLAIRLVLGHIIKKWYSVFNIFTFSPSPGTFFTLKWPKNLIFIWTLLGCIGKFACRLVLRTYENSEMERANWDQN